jgi:hypothetical protein
MILDSTSKPQTKAFIIAGDGDKASVCDTAIIINCVRHSRETGLMYLDAWTAPIKRYFGFIQHEIRRKRYGRRSCLQPRSLAANLGSINPTASTWRSGEYLFQSRIGKALFASVDVAPMLMIFQRTLGLLI